MSSSLHMRSVAGSFNSSRSSLLLKAKADAAKASVRAAMGCKSDEARLLLEQQRLMAAQQQMHIEQQQMQQQIHLEQLKREEEAAMAKPHF